MEKTKKKRRKLKPVNAVFIILLVLLVGYTLFILFSLGWCILTSLKSSNDFLMNNNVLGLPNLSDVRYNSRDEFLRFGNYTSIFKDFVISIRQPFYQFGNYRVHSTNATLLVMLLNTLLYVFGGALIYAFMPCFTAYLCAKYD